MGVADSSKIKKSNNPKTKSSTPYFSPASIAHDNPVRELVFPGLDGEVSHPAILHMSSSPVASGSSWDDEDSLTT